VILGVDISDDAVRTIAIDSEGTFLQQDYRPLTPGAIAAGMRAVATDRVVALGIAVHAWFDQSLRQNAIAAASDFAAEPRFVMRGAAFALAEQWRGAAVGARHVVALVADAYVDAGVVIDGRIFGGAHGFAGAAGWLALNPVERDDYRRFGCLDAEVSGPGIVQRLVWRVKAGDPSRAVDRAGGDLSAIATGHVFDAARQGDGVAVGVVRDTARYLGMGVANLVVALDPEIVVIGGLVLDAEDLILEPCRAEALRRLPPEIASKLQVVAGTLGDVAVALGAARVAILAE
jgi:predicted NBD/HSP70 family sugar kinase